MLNRCYLCNEKEETSDHLILFYKKATMLWSLIFSLIGVQCVLHSSIKRNLLDWHDAFVGKRREKAWRAATLCLMWTLLMKNIQSNVLKIYIKGNISILKYNPFQQRCSMWLKQKYGTLIWYNANLISKSRYKKLQKF